MDKQCPPPVPYLIYLIEFLIIDLKKKFSLFFSTHEKNQLHCQDSIIVLKLMAVCSWKFKTKNNVGSIFDTTFWYKKITHKKSTVKLSNKVSHLYIFLQTKNQSSWSNICKEIFPTQFSDLFSIMDLISIFFAQPGDFFPTDLFHPKKSLNWKKFLYNNCSTELRSHTRKIPLPKKSKFEDTYYALNRTKKTVFTQIFSIFWYQSQLKCVFLTKSSFEKPNKFFAKKFLISFFSCFLSAILV